jgi:hypothetical protein
MRTITVKCPKCREVLEVDPATGAVVGHREEAKARPGADFLGERLRALDGEKARREALVAEGRAKEQARPAAVERLFRKVQEESAGGAPAEKPVRDIDID